MAEGRFVLAYTADQAATLYVQPAELQKRCCAVFLLHHASGCNGNNPMSLINGRVRIPEIKLMNWNNHLSLQYRSQPPEKQLFKKLV